MFDSTINERCATVIRKERVKVGEEWIEKDILCNTSTSWKCDVCERAVCHNHFSTLRAGPIEENHIHKCHECINVDSQKSVLENPVIPPQNPPENPPISEEISCQTPN